MVELGAVCGPTKLSLLWAISSGRDLAKGNITKVDTPWTMGPQVMDPYQFLMFETYAGGNDGGWQPTQGVISPDVSFMSYDKGQMADAMAYAARLDYAVAANLNVWFSGIYAQRYEKNGWLKGGKTSTGALSTPTQRFAHVATWYGATSGEFGGPINPFVDNNFLGWEANAGADWKLLEGLTFSTRYSYWQPGDWFTQAYMAVVPFIGTTGVAGGFPFAVNNGVLQGRDAIQAKSDRSHVVL